MARITTGNRRNDKKTSGTGQRRITAKGSEDAVRGRRYGNGTNTRNHNKKPVKATQKPQRRHNKPRRAAIVAIIVIVAAACGGGVWYATHSGDGKSTVGVGTTKIKSDSKNIKANDSGSLHDFATVKEYTDSIGGGKVTNALAVGNDDGTAVTVNTKMKNVAAGWCGTVVLFDKDSKEIGRGDISMPQDIGGSSETMQYISVDASKVAYWKLYETDAVDASADFSGIDVVGNKHTGDTGDDEDGSNKNGKSAGDDAEHGGQDANK